MFLVPTDTPGVNIVRNLGLGGEPLGEGSHALIHYDDVRVPADALLGGEGQAFAIAQTRLGGGRIHHAMRTIGMAQKALDMMCERALSRETQGSLLADKQFVQGYIADSYAQLMQFRLFVLYTAWSIDKHNDYRKVRKDIAAVKVLMPGVLHDIAQRAIQVHGALGVSNEMPLHGMLLGASVMGLADGPTEVHKVTVARQVLRDYQAERRPLAHPAPPEAAGRGPREVRRAPRARGGEPVIDIDAPRRLDGRRRACPARASRSSTASSPAARRTRSTRSAAATSTARCASRRRRRPSSRDDGIIREWRIIEALDGTDVPHTAGHRRLHRPVGARPHLLPHGLRRRLVADGPETKPDGSRPGPSRSTPTSRPARASPSSSSRASPCSSKVDWQAKGLEDLGRPDGFHERQVDRWTAFLERIKGRELPGLRRGRPPGCAPTSRSTTSRASCTATTSSPT